MGGLVRTLLIIVGLVLAVAVGGYFLVPPVAARTETITVERPPASVFARLASTPANTQIAEGVTLTQVTSAENNVVEADVAFADGATGEATYTVSQEGAGSRVQLKLARNLGANPLDRIQALTGGTVGPQAQAAAATITADLEAVPNASFDGLAYSIETVEAKPFLYNQNCSPQDAGEIKEAVTQSLLVLQPLLTRYRLQQDGPPVAVETSWENNQYCFQIGYRFIGTPPRIYAGGTVGQTPAGQAIRVHYNGPEENVLPLYTQMEAMIASARLTQGRSFEVYNDDATAVGGSANRDVYYMVEGDTTQLARLFPPTAVAAVPAPAAVAPAATTTTAPAATTTTAPATP